jgi:Na+-transporting methylmalonyl-CoA/oxaloacetate decarboxylase gamma subunit
VTFVAVVLLLLVFVAGFMLGVGMSWLVRSREAESEVDAEAEETNRWRAEATRALGDVRWLEARLAALEVLCLEHGIEVP